MGGKSYYCDYCDCFMKNDINVRKNHNVGIVHKIAKANYIVRFKQPEEIVAEEKQKMKCNRFLNNLECQFGFFCHYSHYSEEEIVYLEWLVDKNKMNKKKQADTAKNLPWKYSNRQNYKEPSLQVIDFDRITESCLENKWG